MRPWLRKTKQNNKQTKNLETNPATWNALRAKTFRSPAGQPQVTDSVLHALTEKNQTKSSLGYVHKVHTRQVNCIFRTGSIPCSILCNSLALKVWSTPVQTFSDKGNSVCKKFYGGKWARWIMRAGRVNEMTMMEETGDRDRWQGLNNDPYKQRQLGKSDTNSTPGVIIIKYGRWASKGVHHFCGYADAIWVRTIRIFQHWRCAEVWKLGVNWIQGGCFLIHTSTW